MRDQGRLTIHDVNFCIKEKRDMETGRKYL